MILLATSCFAAAHHSHLVQIPNRGHTWLPSLSFQGQDSLGFQLLFILRARATHRVTVHSPPPRVPQASGPPTMLMSGVALLAQVKLEGGAAWGGSDNIICPSVCPFQTMSTKVLRWIFVKKK